MSINFTASRRAPNPFVLYFYIFGINGVGEREKNKSNFGIKVGVNGTRIIEADRKIIGGEYRVRINRTKKVENIFHRAHSTDNTRPWAAANGVVPATAKGVQLRSGAGEASHHGRISL